ncbi:SUMF1/EgtB/PvdO family nonheme iron enzyme [Bradyrhizobium diazoefficiens]|uniref:SUMF1/EgtB/PvdO family nonheme iron enzyme n=1 Tax=Bradyrhizobium diazoefficiens TaxID=1355477 RepID=UPI00272AA78E|nr:SUMF1/EgtB/PvdO family nonheme iron enzyme [Bradyrhizobium diazoefficiens]WLA67320.1 SUMF1/EgtB/PvdO family nonheme iron enzyme [Bradyrhizobium diazoefficiens]
MGEIRNFRSGNQNEPPSHGAMPRRLAAIIVGDIASYSRLMQADEEGTHVRVKRIERDLVEPSIVEHHGSLVKTTGDGFIAIFDSPVEAVRCSIVIQQNLIGRNASLPKHSRIEYRIGVNLGDVIIEPDDVYGDGVNIATRIEGIAEPGQVYISGAIYEQIKHKVVCGYEALGDRKVKNITDPVRIYRVLPDADAVGGTRGRRENTLIFLLSLTLLVSAAGVLWYLLAQPPGKGSEQAATPTASPVASPVQQPPARESAVPTPQPSPSLASPAPPAPTPTPSQSPTPASEPDMTAIRGGSFTMGSNDDPTERPVHQVAIKPFSIGKYPVTVREWNECAAAKACGFTAIGKDDAPVTNVSWTDAQQYAAWLAQATKKPYRLPSEAEWEYAARGGTQSKYWWGDKLQPGMAGCKDCGDAAGEQPAKVGSFKPNPFGLYDMGGGVDQWVADCWHRTYQGAPNDGSAWSGGDCSSHVLRSGSWKNDSRYVRPSNRDGYDTNVRYPTHGFRVALGP